MRIAVTISALLLVGCDNRPDQWDAFVYADGADLSGYERISGFKSFELCQRAAIDRLRSIQRESGGDYECGYRCESNPSPGGISFCKETRK